MTPGLAATLFTVALLGCEASVEDLGTLVASYVPPTITLDDLGVRRINSEQSIIGLSALPDTVPEDGTLLFMDGRATSALEAGRVGWADASGGRIVVLDEDNVVERVLQGAPAGGLPPTQPWFAVAAGGSVRAIQPDGAALVFENGEPLRWEEAPLPGPVVAGRGDRVVAVRTIMDFDLRTVGANEPLFWVIDGGGEPRGVGEPQGREDGFLGQLANTGWAALDADGGVYFASATQPSLQRFAPDGTLQWESRWTPDTPFEAPRFAFQAGSAQPLFAVHQYGVRVGPDGRVYVLAAAAPGARATTLLSFESDGTWTGRVDIVEGSAVLADSRGRVSLASPDRVLERTPEVRRVPFPPFSLAALAGGDSIALEAYRGRVVVLNFWASWCGPCRREMPLLNDFARGLDPEDAVVLGLNEDTRGEAGLAFLGELGGVVYPNAAGRGDLRARYRYRGLPYTVVLDREGRVASSFYGFGTSIEPIVASVLTEISVPAGG